MNEESKYLRVKGHRVTHSTSGCEDTYRQGSCECGEWRYRGWTEKRGQVTQAHQAHLWIVLHRREKANAKEAA